MPEAQAARSVSLVGVSRATLASLLCALQLSCAGTPVARGPGVADVGEALAPLRVSFPIHVPFAGDARVAGLLWVPEGEPSSVLLCVHGSGGEKENWGPIPVPGYSFAHAMTREGRAVLAIDLPGYGESKAASPRQSAEEFALVIDQVARALRSGDYGAQGTAARRFGKVVGVGLSVGALFIEIAQGTWATFDALVAGGWVSGAFSPEYRACLYRDTCAADPLSEVWYTPALEPAVETWLRSHRPNRLQPSGRTSVHLWGGLVFTPTAHGGDGEGAPLPPDAPSLAELAQRIRVPVLLLFGDHDALYDLEKIRQEPSRFTAAPAVKLEWVPDAGHFIRWHRSNAQADAKVVAWLRGQGL